MYLCILIGILIQILILILILICILTGEYRANGPAARQVSTVDQDPPRESKPKLGEDRNFFENRRRLQEIQGEFFPKVWVGEDQAGMLAGPTKVDKGDMEDPQKVDRNLGTPRSLESLEGLVEHNLVKELLEEEGEVIKRPPRAWRPLGQKMERFFSTMMINKRLHKC